MSGTFEDERKLKRATSQDEAGQEASATQSYADTVFAQADTDGNGKLDAGEIRAVAESLGKKFTDLELGTLMADLNQDVDGEVDIADFREWFEKSGGDFRDLLDAPDGGYGWVIVAVCFSSLCCTLGQAYAAGVYFPLMLETFNESAGATAMLSGSLFFAMLGTGLLTGALIPEFGHLKVWLAGSVLICAGPVLASFATALWQVVVLFGLFGGAGMNFIFFTGNMVLPYWFDKRRGMAFGLSSAGGGVGTFVWSLVAGIMIDAYDWRIALRMQGVVSLVVLLPLGFLITTPTRRARKQAGLPPENIEKGPDAAGNICVAVARNIDCSMYGDRDFQLLISWAFCILPCWLAPYVHLVKFAQDSIPGVTMEEASKLLVYLGVGSLVGRLAITPLDLLFDRFVMGLIILPTIFVALLCVAFADAYWQFVLFVGVYGTVTGVMAAMFFALMSDVFIPIYGIDHLPKISGLLTSTMAPLQLMAPVGVGVLYDVFGGYREPFIICAVFAIVGVVPLVLLWRRNEARKKGALALRQPRRPRREGELREADALRVLLAVLCALLVPLWIYARWG